MLKLHLAKIPNKKLIEQLYKDYYSSEINPDNANDLSSHWKYHSQQFNVYLNKEKDYLNLKGIGFGDMTSKNSLHQLLNYLGHCFYLLQLADKKNIFRLIPSALIICKKGGFYFSFDCFKQVCSLALIQKYISNGIKKKRLTFLIIGDGHGFLSSLIKHVFPQATIILIDIGKTLLFQAAYCQKIYPQYLHCGVYEMSNLKAIDFLYCPSEFLEKISSFKIDIVINIASMQEMNTQAIQGYFSFLRTHCNTENLFYCCNREFKKLIGGEILEFLKYPWDKRDIHLVDELCPWYRYFLSFHNSKNGPKIFGVKIPFVNYFDGPLRHRLTMLSKDEVPLCQ